MLFHSRAVYPFHTFYAKLPMLIHRPRRNRKSETIRRMVRETHLHVSQLIYPVFILPGTNRKEEIISMPGIFRFSLDLLLPELAQCAEWGLRQIVLFPAVPDEWKDPTGTYSYQADNFYLEAIRQIKAQLPEVCIMTDVALDPYSSDGHDGIVKDGRILNDETLPILANMSVAQAEAGADIIGPSDMMDGRVGVIREALDRANFSEVSIMSYTAKYASAFYGPFRDALDSAPKFGDKKTYQMDPANHQEALIEAELDVAEGADMIMVKPAMAYLDIISRLHEHTLVPIAAYQVSGEYAMLKAASLKGWLNEADVMYESLISIKRAGASLILTYFAKTMAEKWAQEGMG